MHKLALLIHILGAIGLFVALGIQFAAMRGLRQATSPDQARAVLATVTKVKIILGPSMILLILSGLYMGAMAAQTGRPTGWMIVALVSFIAMGAISSLAGDKKTKELQKELLSSKGTLSDELLRKAREPRALTPLVYTLGLALGIVVLMVFRPEIVTAVIIMGAAFALSFMTSLVLTRQA